jgi:hypothetical protein
LKRHLREGVLPFERLLLLLMLLLELEHLLFVRVIGGLRAGCGLLLPGLRLLIALLLLLLLLLVALLLHRGHARFVVLLHVLNGLIQLLGRFRDLWILRIPQDV